MNSQLKTAGFSLLLFLAAIAAAPPKYSLGTDWRTVSVWTYETGRVPSLLAQLHDPGRWDVAFWTDPYFSDNALRWRLLLPAVGHILHLPAPAYLGLPWVGLFGLLWISVHYLRRAGLADGGLLAAGILVGTSAAFFCAANSIGMMDPFYLIALVVFTFSPSNLPALGACLLGPWIDEKFLLVLPLCALVRWGREPSWAWVRWAVLGISPYCLVRLVAWGAGDSGVARQLAMQQAVLGDYLPQLPWGWLFGFRCGWLMVGLGVGSAFLALRRGTRWLLPAALLAGTAALGLLAFDTTKSIAALLPLLLVGAAHPRAKPWLPAMAALNLLLPAGYYVNAHPTLILIGWWS